VNESRDRQGPLLGGDEGRLRVYGCLALLLVGLYLAVGPKLRLSEWRVTPDGNTALAEALAWKRGTLSLPRDYYEDAEAHGKHYNVVGLGFVVLSVLGTTLTGWLGGPAGTFSPLLYVAMVALPLPFVAYWAFRTVTRSSVWAAVLSFYLIAGTSLLPVMVMCKDGPIYKINHVLAVVGLLVFAADLLGPRRIWPAVLGLCLTAWSRQMTCLYALPLLWLALHDGEAGTHRSAAGATETSPPAAPDGRRRRRDLRLALVGVCVIAGVPMTLNAMKFGNPLETGYRLLYAGRNDPIAQRAHRQFFGPANVKMQAFAMNLAYPKWDIRAGTLYLATGQSDGGSIWLTSPLLLGIFFTARWWWRDRRRRALMLGTLPVIGGLLCYHTTGAGSAGFYRYSLDFIPIWLMVIAPYTMGRRGVLLTLACLAVSTLYFNILRF